MAKPISPNRRSPALWILGKAWFARAAIRWMGKTQLNERAFIAILFATQQR